jgi:hypothetical protein
MEEVEKARAEINRRTSLVEKCRRQVASVSAGSYADGTGVSSMHGRSYELRLDDDAEGNIFYATLDFVGSDAVWRYTKASPDGQKRTQGKGTIRMSGRKTVSFHDGKGEWSLAFSSDHRQVRGTYSFWQEWPGTPRMRRYKVTGSAR